MLSKLLVEYQETDLIRKAIVLFSKNPKDTRLDTHPLRKRLKGKFAFTVDDDVRVVFEWLGKSKVRFLAIGRHKEVYGKNKKA